MDIRFLVHDLSKGPYVSADSSRKSAPTGPPQFTLSAPGTSTNCSQMSQRTPQSPEIKEKDDGRCQFHKIREEATREFEEMLARQQQEFLDNQLRQHQDFLDIQLRQRQKFLKNQRRQQMELSENQKHPKDVSKWTREYGEALSGRFRASPSKVKRLRGPPYSDQDKRDLAALYKKHRAKWKIIREKYNENHDPRSEVSLKNCFKRGWGKTDALEAPDLVSEQD